MHRKNPYKNPIINEIFDKDEDRILNQEAYIKEKIHNIEEFFLEKEILDEDDIIDLKKDPFTDVTEVKAPTTPEEVKSFLGRKPNVNTYELYGQIAYENRKSMPKSFHPAYLLMAAEVNFQTAKLIFTSTLCNYLTAEDLIDIYYSHRHSERFLEIVPKIQPNIWLPILVSKHHPSNSKLINESLSLQKIFKLQLKLLADIRHHYRKQHMFGGSGAPEFERKKEEPLSVDPKLQADVEKLIEDKINPYEILGVPQTATADDIKKAYRAKAVVIHPDKVPETEKEAAKIKFQQLGTAKDVLSDPNARKYYDRKANQAPKFRFHS